MRDGGCSRKVRVTYSALWNKPGLASVTAVDRSKEGRRTGKGAAEGESLHLGSPRQGSGMSREQSLFGP